MIGFNNVVLYLRTVVDPGFSNTAGGYIVHAKYAEKYCELLDYLK